MRSDTLNLFNMFFYMMGFSVLFVGCNFPYAFVFVLSQCVELCIYQDVSIDFLHIYHITYIFGHLHFGMTHVHRLIDSPGSGCGSGPKRPGSGPKFGTDLWAWALELTLGPWFRNP